MRDILNDSLSGKNVFKSAVPFKACTVYNDHPRDPRIVAIFERCSLFRGHLSSKSSKWSHKTVVVIDMWSLFGGGR